MINNLFSVRRINVAVIGLILSLLFVLPALAQPTSIRDFPYPARMKMAQERIKDLEQLSSQIENDKLNVSLYKKRLQIYADLGSLYYGKPNYWRDTYADKYEADLSNIVELEKTAWNYYQRGEYITEKLRRLSVKNVSDIYPRNQYFDLAVSDFLKALQLTSDPQEKQRYYAYLSDIYSLRPKLLVSSPDFPKWKNEIPLKLIREDFEMSLKYSQLALKAGISLPYIKELKKDWNEKYLFNADVAAKLGDSATALKFTQAAQKYRE